MQVLYVCLWLSLFSCVFLCDLALVSFSFSVPTLEGKSIQLTVFPAIVLHMQEHIMRKLSFTADTAKKKSRLDLVFHTTTHNGHGWKKGYQTYNPSCKDSDFLSLNDSKWKSCSLRGRPQNRVAYWSHLPTGCQKTSTFQHQITFFYFFMLSNLNRSKFRWCYFLKLLWTVFGLGGVDSPNIRWLAQDWANELRKCLGWFWYILCHKKGHCFLITWILHAIDDIIMEVG